MQATLIYPTETEFQEFLETTDHAQGLILAEFQERIKEDFSVPAGDQLAKLGLVLQAV